MQYVQAAQNLREAFREAMQFVGDVRLENLLAYLRTADLSTDEIETESRITLTTVHKAKGKEYDTVIYTPTKPPNSSNYQDEFVEAVLKTEGIDAKEELEEEVLRINFVAFTRAKKKLAIIGEKISDMLNDRSVEGELSVGGSADPESTESQKKAFAFFVSGEYDRARELLKKKESWLTDYVKNFFGTLRHISFSSAPDKAYEYLVNSILDLREQTVSLARGLSVHTLAEDLIKKGDCECPTELAQYRDNISSLLRTIRMKYPEVEAAEHVFRIPLNKLILTDEELMFTGKIDAVFRNGDSYLIVDWKTDKTQENASYHRQQLEAYKRAFCHANGIDPDKVKISLAFIGLKPKLNMGTMECELDEKQPAKTSFDTFAKRVQNVLRWKKDPESFFHEILENEVNDPLWRSFVEQYMRERKV
jgi:DNA helicase-2/ATP-dependent DNA helicase PcrA